MLVTAAGSFPLCIRTKQAQRGSNGTSETARPLIAMLVVGATTPVCRQSRHWYHPVTMDMPAGLRSLTLTRGPREHSSAWRCCDGFPVESLAGGRRPRQTDPQSYLFACMLQQRIGARSGKKDGQQDMID